MTLKYDELMDKIEVTDAMRARILTRVSGAAKKKSAARRWALADAVGFPVSEATELPFEPLTVHYTSYWGQMAEISYEAGDQTAELRKSPGTEENSGDYTVYPATEQLTVADLDIQLRGDAQDAYTLAVWTDGQ